MIRHFVQGVELTGAQLKAHLQAKEKKAVAVRMLNEALGACKMAGVLPEGIAAMIIDNYDDAKQLETLSNILGRNAHELERYK